ncbi:MAG: hypothetical protein JNL93_24060 [Pelomonas sp.]|nr:hypothetical protein [Roseateles sp.]
MFVSRPEYEFPIPAALDQPGTQHWRVIELSLHVPWYLLSVEIADEDDPEFVITRTICIAWEFDLADVLRDLDAKRVLGIVCMMPAWQSPTGQWGSREIREVWLCRSDSVEHVLLTDAAGERFNFGLIPEPAGKAETALLLWVAPTAPRVS